MGERLGLRKCGSREAPCDPTTDTYCYLTFPASATTNTYGEYTFSTDALPDSWSVGATGDSTCPNGGSSNGTITNDGSVYVYCNSFTVGTAVAAPDNCTITINENPGGGETNNCPSTITVTTSESELPTSYAVNVANYDDTASEENASQITPSSSTSIVVPTPNAVGENAVIIVDPTTNQVIATASFLIHMQIILPGSEMGFIAELEPYPGHAPPTLGQGASCHPRKSGQFWRGFVSVPGG